MSSDTQTPIVVVKKTKAPSLVAKHSRFMAFGYWFIVNNSELLSEELREQLFHKLAIFSTVEEQTTFYEGFESQLSEMNKTIRKMVAASKKPAKTKSSRAKKTKDTLPQCELVAQLIADANDAGVEVSQPVAAEKKPKAPRAKKTKEATETASDATTAEKKPKAPRAKKQKTTAEPTVEPVPELAAEPTVEPVPELAAEPTVEPVPELAAEPTVEPVPELAAEPTVEPTVEPATKPTGVAEKKTKAPRVKKTTEGESTETQKKTKKTKSQQQTVQESPEEDIQTRFVNIHDKEYLIDENNNLYNVESPHEKVGNFNPETSAVNLM